MIAILSDIHGNFEALIAVLTDIERQGVTAIYCLGDTFGYGPNPLECLDLVMKCHGMTVVLQGNFDYGVLHSPVGFGVAAERSILWTQALLAQDTRSPNARRRADFLASLVPSYVEGDVLFVHASARHPLNEYVFPDDIHNTRKMLQIGEKIERLCFCGHTHVPGVFQELRAGEWEYFSTDQFEQGFPTAGQKLVCNVGSVGQPRDQDWRACYALFEGERFHIRRVEYDVETTVRKIQAIPELDDFLGERLREGR